VFIGVDTEHPRTFGQLEREITAIEDVLECHHVTGLHTLMLKAKTRSTETLEHLIDRIRSLEGVASTETSVVLSTHAERTRLGLAACEDFDSRPTRRSGRPRTPRALK
jgi:Lrp/AsnC family leucine-responsive transcriptional regulator